MQLGCLGQDRTYHLMCPATMKVPVGLAFKACCEDRTFLHDDCASAAQALPGEPQAQIKAENNYWCTWLLKGDSSGA